MPQSHQDITLTAADHVYPGDSVLDPIYIDSPMPAAYSPPPLDDRAFSPPPPSVLLDYSSTSRSFHPESPIIPDPPLTSVSDEPIAASMAELSRWHSLASSSVPRLPDTRLVLMWGSTVPAIANCLFGLLHHLHQKQDSDYSGVWHHPEDMIACRSEVYLNSFIQDFRDFRW